MSEHFSAGDAYHHSQNPRTRWPQGALPSGATVRIRLELSARLHGAYCLLCTSFNGHDGIELMDYRGTDESREIYEASLSFPQTGLARYSFLINDGSRLLYYGLPDGTRTGGLGALSSRESAPFQITVYDGAYRTPDWFKKAVAYQIFVDRFARGRATRGSYPRAAFHREKGRTIYLHRRWNEPPLHSPLPGRRYYDPCDFFGGDLRGVIDKLPYLHRLGVTCLYFNPIFESPTNHKYNTGDYRRIDPMYGTEEDFAELCEKAGALSMHVMLDGVFSHTGDDSVYFNRYGRYDSTGAYQSPGSPYYPWYQFTRFPEEYRSWWGFDTLPEVDENQPTFQDFIARNDDSVLKHWVRAGAKGWRLDVADELPDSFIRMLRQELKKADPDAVLLGEVWEDASNKFSGGEQRRYVMGAELDSVMNYPLRTTLLDFLRGSLPSERARAALCSLQENYPPQFFYACLNLLSSHDVPRALSLLGGGPDKDAGLTREQQAAFSLTPEMRRKGLSLMRLAVLLQMTLPGVPCVYYGDEAGLEGLMDPFNRTTYPWGREEKALVSWHRTLISLRNASAALQTGHMALYAPHRDVLGVLRYVRGGTDALGDSAQDGVFLALVNRSAAPREASLILSTLPDEHGRVSPLGGQYEDVLSGAGYPAGEGRLRIILPACGCALLRLKEAEVSHERQHKTE